MDDYYTKPDHGHDPDNEFPAWIEYTALAAGFAVTLISALLMSQS